MNRDNPAPIALFAYNRPEHLRKTVEALRANALSSESDLFIFIDGSRSEESRSKNQEVREYAKSVTGFKSVSVTERSENLGLARSIISGVTEIVNRYGRVIVLEDDIVTSPHFLGYMNDALDLYERDEEVISVHGYVYPVKGPLPETFFLCGADCWGWATWRRGWKLFEPDGAKLLAELETRKLEKEFDFGGTYPYTEMLRKQVAGRNDSWAIRWNASAFLKGRLTLYPGRSLVRNIGHDKSGVHGTQGRFYETDLATRKAEVKRLPLEEDRVARAEIERYFRSLKPSIWRRIARKLLP